MRNVRFLTAVVAAICTMIASTPAVAAEPITGRWITSSRDAVVEIAPCGRALCGTIVKFLGPPKGNGDPRDVNNTDPAKRTRRIMGMDILTGFTSEGNEWKGQIYDPRSGKTYRSVLIRKGSKLDVKGCISIFCQTQVWTRAT